MPVPAKGACPVDRHAPRSSLRPADRQPAGMFYAPDPDVEQFWCCTAELAEDGWQHERSCPARARRRAS